MNYFVLHRDFLQRTSVSLLALLFTIIILLGSLSSTYISNELQGVQNNLFTPLGLDSTGWRMFTITPSSALAGGVIHIAKNGTTKKEVLINFRDFWYPTPLDKAYETLLFGPIANIYMQGFARLQCEHNPQDAKVQIATASVTINEVAKEHGNLNAYDRIQPVYTYICGI